MHPEKFRTLLEKYLLDDASIDERSALFQRLSRRPFDKRWAALIDEYFADAAFEAEADPALRDEIRIRLLEAIRQLPQDPPLAQVSRLVPIRPRRWIAAAAILALLATGAWWFLRFQHPPSGSTPVALVHDIPPGHNGAILTLSNGHTIVLDSVVNGTVAVQGSTKLQKSNNRLEYVAPAHAASPGIEYNTLTTPRGRQYALVLPDGSKVWLNAASSIIYPTAFTGKQRRVSITGEAYFDIAPNPRQPFAVAVNGGQPIEVLGTSFNINAYADEPSARTTLLSGAVRVGHLILQPGQQAGDDRGGRVDLIQHADIDQAVAWKNGLFQFKSASIESLMRQLARWYDIEVVYPGGQPQGHITGKLPRDMSLAKLEKALEFSGVHFTIEGNKINVAP
jgi:transmembrane sensor